jgi:TPR repeat protein
MSSFAAMKIVAFAGVGLSLIAPTIAQVRNPNASLLTADSSMDPMAKECLAKIAAPLEKSGGRLSPEVRKAYLDWCWGSVLRALQSSHRSVSSECIEEVEGDPVLKDAMSVAVYPPDPSILQNYAVLREQLGAAAAQKYRALAIGVALARRVKGVEADPGEAVGRENQVPVWAYQPLQGPANDDDRRFIAHIADFMKSKGCSALDLFNGDGLRAQLETYLSGNKVEKRFVDEVAKSAGFGERLKNAMILLGQRPSARTARPACVEWLKHVLALYESTPSSTPSQDGRPMPWPLFSLTSTPWPLLMPLSHPIPMDEAKYLWEAFQGERGPDRYHTYGPYRDDLTEMPDELIPSHWYWNAVPDQIVHGGECMPISLATIDLYSALGKPATDAAQPGHANLISYQNDGGTWKADIEQDFAGGARVTFSQWFFDDQPRQELHFRGLFGWPGAEYHLGLAVGMNLGVTSYLDTRIASRIFDVLPEAAQKTLGLKLLAGALLENPFNPEVWYRIGTQTKNVQEGLALVRDVRAHDASHLYGELPCPPLENFLRSGKSGTAGSDMDLYWSVLQENLARFTVLAKGAPQNETDMHDAYVALSAVPGLDAGELAAFTQRFVGIKTAAAEGDAAAADLKLAEQGDKFGCLRMGQRYLGGDGVPRDEVKAREFLIQAARQGEPSAAFALESINTPLPSDGVEVIASSNYSSTQDVHHLIDGSGMIGGVHDNSVPAATMWQTVDNPKATEPAPGLPASPAWVRFNFPQPRTFDAIEIWNHNQLNLTDRGFRKFQIYGSLDGKQWSRLTHGAELPRASGAPFEPSVLVPTTSSGRLLKSVIIAAAATDGNFGSGDYGLSAVRFVTHPIISTIPAYQIEVHASSQFSDSTSPNHLIDGAGMIGEFHDNQDGAATMWLTKEHTIPTLAAPVLYRSPAWVRFNFTTPRYFEAIRVWNFNQHNWSARGFKKMRIYGTSDGIEWFLLTSTDDIQLPQATGASLSAGTTFFNASPERPIRSVLLIADPDDGNYAGTYFGLSAVRFIVPSSDPVTTK